MKVILFDGECNLCDQTVQWIIFNDKAELFRFASLHSSAGQTLSKKFQISADSVVLIDEEEVYSKSSAVLRICRYIPGYCWVKAGYIVPRTIRDRLYDYIAIHRYRWFGKKAECMVPTPTIKRRFLE